MQFCEEISVPGRHSLDFRKAQPLSEMCTSKCLFDKSLFAVALLFITELKVSLWLLFTTHDVREAALVTSPLILLVHPLLSTQQVGVALTVHYLPLSLVLTSPSREIGFCPD